MKRRTAISITLLAVGCTVAQVSSNRATVPEQTKASMDFWVGEWDVYTMDGKLAGTNRIEKVMGGAAILEHWENSGGIEGKSWFYWMADKKKWKQVWVTPDGAYKEKVAEAVEGGLLFTGTAFSQTAMCKTSSQMLCAFGRGRAAACSAVTSARISRRDGPCQASPS